MTLRKFNLALDCVPPLRAGTKLKVVVPGTRLMHTTPQRLIPQAAPVILHTFLARLSRIIHKPTFHLSLLKYEEFFKARRITVPHRLLIFPFSHRSPTISFVRSLVSLCCRCLLLCLVALRYALIAFSPPHCCRLCYHCFPMLSCYSLALPSFY